MGAVVSSVPRSVVARTFAVCPRDPIGTREPRERINLSAWHYSKKADGSSKEGAERLHPARRSRPLCSPRSSWTRTNQRTSSTGAPQSRRGGLVALEVSERVPVLTTADKEQTALLLRVIWKRQGKEAAAYGLRHKPKTLTLEERQRFLVEGL